MRKFYKSTQTKSVYSDAMSKAAFCHSSNFENLIMFILGTALLVSIFVVLNSLYSELSVILVFISIIIISHFFYGIRITGFKFNKERSTVLP